MSPGLFLPNVQIRSSANFAALDMDTDCILCGGPGNEMRDAKPWELDRTVSASSERGSVPVVPLFCRTPEARVAVRERVGGAARDGSIAACPAVLVRELEGILPLSLPINPSCLIYIDPSQAVA